MALSLLAFRRLFVNPIHTLIVEAREILLVLMAVVVLVSPDAGASAVKTERTVRVVMDNAYAPYAFQSDEGRLEGILIDQWQAWERKTGIKAEIRAMDWSEALRRMRAGQFDVIDCIVETPDRRKYFDFTPPYATIEAPIYFRNEISGIADLASLEGFPVAVKAGDQHVDKLKANGVTTVIAFGNNDEIIEAAKQHKVNVFVMDAPSALYLLNKAGIESEFRHSAPIFRDQLRRAVRKGDAAMLRTVSEGFAAIEPGELKRIDEKWFGHTINRYSRYLIYASYAAAIAALLIAGLVVWNRALSKRILQRTAALGESEQRFRQIAENIHEVFWLIDIAPRTMLYVSPAYEAVWGRSRESLYRDPLSFLDGIHPEDRPRVATVIEHDHDQDVDIEYRVVKTDGSIRSIRARGFPIKDESGRFYRIAGIAEDITERKAAEEKLKQSESQLAEAQRLAHVGSWTWDISNDTVTGSDEIYRMLDVRGGEIEPIHDALSFSHPDDRDLLLRTIESSLGTREPFSLYHRILRRDGNERIVHSCGRPVSDEDGKLIGAFGITQDVTELKRAEEELKSLTEQLRALSARIQSAREEESIRIARAIHDELGSALTSLRWDLEGIAKAFSEPGPRSQLQDMRNKMAATLRLTDTTINIVRRIASELRPDVLDVLGLTEAIAWQGQQFRDRTGIAVQSDLLVDDVDLDPQQSTAVFRIFQEALTNILRHAQATRVDVTIAEEADALVLTIRDDGRGITEDEKSGPLAIGLLGMRERAHLVGAEIFITGVEGEGTTVTVRLPLVRVETMEPEEA